jgi:hypothetical protein
VRRHRPRCEDSQAWPAAGAGAAGPGDLDAAGAVLAHRESQRTANPHLVVTLVTKAGTEPASTAYFSHLLDASGVPPRTVRCTRLADLVNTMDPKIVAATFGMDPEGAMFYLADHVDHTRFEPPNQ